MVNSPIPKWDPIGFDPQPTESRAFLAPPPSASERRSALVPCALPGAEAPRTSVSETQRGQLVDAVEKWTKKEEGGG